MNQKIAKWVKWLGSSDTTGTIACELVNLANIRKVQHGLQEIVAENPMLNRPSLFYSVEQTIYAQSVLLFIRRQVRPDSDSISLFDLAEDMHNYHHLITADFYSELYSRGKPDETKEYWKELGLTDFKKIQAPNKNCINPEILQEMRTTLDKIANDSKPIIDRRLAHLDKREPQSVPTYGQIENWCDQLNDIFRRLYLFLTASDFSIGSNSDQEWREIFKFPWINPSGR
jgi:hypothetical protein